MTVQQSHNVNVPHYSHLVEQLSTVIDSTCIVTSKEQCLAYGTDASFYRLIPKVVLRLSNLDELIHAIKCCEKLEIPFTFRAAGTSLSGQAVSDSVLFTLTDDWRGHTIHNDGDRITLQPGVIGADANRYLKPFNKKIGPDPASIDTCKIGGIAANNASGMCCGTAQNSYKTVDGMKIVFADGSQLNTSDPESIEYFYSIRRDLVEGLTELATQTKLNRELTQKIHHKYRLKNTTGYSLNALVDYEDPIEILQHLMIGSEGTLGFISEITYNTVVEHAYKSTSLLVFDNIEEASKAVTALSNAPVASVEMMDGRALSSVANKPGLPSFIRSLSLEATALLIESHASSQQSLDQQTQQVLDILHPFSIIESVPFTQDQQTVATLWGIRKGMFPAVGAVREVGTTVIIEDVAFPIEDLAAGVRDLQSLFDEYRYSEAIIFGHALEGNLHFVFTQSFDNQHEVERYGNFMDKVADLVAIKYQGSLKAEHGTGRNMAPYVELEWGKDAYQLMQQIKTLFDPKGLLNPGVIINDDPHAHIQHLKPMPASDPIVDKCIECGFCEPVCPSRSVTLSPRQRIVLFREIKRREAQNQSSQSEELTKLFEYQGLDTCAATGLCADRCPVGINTGDLVKQLRATKYQKYQPIARWTAKHFSTTTSFVKIGLKTSAVAANLIGMTRFHRFTKQLRLITKGTSPNWLPEVPNNNSFDLLKHTHQQPTAHSQTERCVVYVPSCASRAMGTADNSYDCRPLTEVTLSLLKKAGFLVITPQEIDDQCCGMPYESKGMANIAYTKAQQLEEVLWHASEQGRYPILMDTSPCAKRSIEHFEKQMKIYEPVKFATDHLLPNLQLKPIDESVLVHITCSSRRMGLQTNMLELARSCASHVIVPEHIQCCGWAGDKGFNTPELNSAALSSLRSQVPEDCKRGFSNSITCEIGLSHHSGISYQSILYLLDEVSLSNNGENQVNPKL
jgi:D-lactate dehydrogenase